MKTFLCSIAAVAVVGLCGVSGAETITPGSSPVWASRAETVTFDVGAGETATQSGIIGVEPGARFEKIGSGTMALPLNTIVEPGDFDLSVREGTVRLSNGTKPAEPKPEAILAKAAFWLDAATNVIETTDTEGDLGTYVSEWRDCRETATAVPLVYPHGYLRKLTSGTESAEVAALRPRKTSAGGFGKPAVDFQGYGSYCALAFARPNSATPATTPSDYADYVCRDIFVVHSVTRDGDGDSFGGFGFLLGARNNAFHPSGAGFSLSDKYFVRSEFPQQFDARWWMNGKEFDAAVEPVKVGDYVHDSKHYGAPPYVNSLFAYYGSTTSLFKRNGGDLVYEVILFTNALTEVEHTQVRRYLNAKYLGTADVTVGSRTVRLADAASAEVTPGTTNVALVGQGTATKAVGDSLTWGYVPGSLFGGRFPLTVDDPGKLALRDDVTVGLSQGGVLAASNLYYGVHTALASGDATALVKTGNSNVRIGAVPDGVKTIDVQGGVLTVARETDASSVAGVAAEAVITNPDFQLNAPTAVNWLNGHKSGKPSKINGWTCVDSPGWVPSDDVYAVITPYISTDNNWYMTQTRKDDPTDAWMALRGGVQVFTDVQVPADGRYEVSLDVMYTSSGYPTLTVWVGPDTNNLQYAGAIVVHTAGKWVRRSVRTPRLTAGANVLLLRQDVYTGEDGAAKSSYKGVYRLIDNITMKTLTVDADAFDVPNGDFERYVNNEAYVKNDNLAGRGFATVFSEGWTYVQPDWTNATASATVTTEALFIDSNVSTKEKTTPYFNRTFPNSGTGQLLLGASNALAKTTFRMPSGTWRLRADMSTWRRSNLTAKMRPETAPGKLNAAVRIGGTTVNLGLVTLTGLQAKTACWPTVFTVPAGGAEVELSLWVSSINCGANVDNLVCVPDTVVGNLVTDGDFNQTFAAGRWQGATPGKTTSGPMGRLAAMRSEAMRPGDSTQHAHLPENYKGTAGGYAGIIGDCGCLYQSLTIPADGRYRLTYYTRERCNLDTTEAARHAYGNNVFRLSLATAGGVTNILDETLVASTNWVRHSTLFSAKAGSYTFVIEGLNHPTTTSVDTRLNSGWDKRGFVSGVSIVRTSVTPSFETVFSPESVVKVAEGAKLRLGFSGTNRVSRVRLGGLPHSGIISRETYPEYILGEGALEVERRGAVIVVR